jgi:hypothetical protein
LFLYPYICAPTTAFPCLSKFCTLQLSIVYLLISGPLMVQCFIFEGDLQCSKLFKETICKGGCTCKCIEKHFFPFTPPPPSISSLNLSPHTEFKEALLCGMYSIIHLSKIYPFFSTPSPSIPTSLLCRVFCCHIGPASFRIVGLDSEKTIGHP